MHSPDAAELAGRADELSSLRDRIASARTGRGGVIVLAGTAGIGKSALASVAAAEAESAGFKVTVGRAWEFAEAPPWFPVRGCLRSLGIAGATLPTADAESFGLWEEVLDGLARVSRDAPVLWVLEDLHAADAQTLDLIAFLAQPIRSLAVAIVITVRDPDPRLEGAAGRRLTRIRREGTVIVPTPLPSAEVQALARRILGRELEPSAAEHLVARTGGNPFFVVECCRALRSGGREADLPSTVLQVVRERLDALPSVTRSLLEQSAILGRELTSSLLATMAGRLPAVVIDGLQPAVRSGLLEELEPGRFRFAHALVRDAVHDAIPAERRATEHARAEEALAALGEGPDRLVERASHALDARGAIAAERIETIVRAAIELLSTQGARDRAFALWRRLQGTRESVDVPDLLYGARLAASAGVASESRRLAGVARVAASGNPARIAEAALVRGLTLHPGIVDPELVRVLDEALRGLGPPEPHLRARVKARLAAAMQPSSTPDIPMAMAREAIAEARALGDETLLSDVLYLAGSALTDFADLEETHAIAGELLTRAIAAGDNERALRAMARLALGHLELGEITAWDRECDRAIELSRSVGHPLHTWRPLMLASARALARGHVDESDRALTEIEQMSRLIDDPALTVSLQGFAMQRALMTADVESLRAFQTSFEAALAAYPIGEFVRAMLRVQFAMRLGDRAEVTRLLPTLMKGLPGSSRDAESLYVVAEAAASVGSPAEREEALRFVMPRAKTQVHGGHISFSYLGPARRFVALLDAAGGRTDSAVEGMRDSIAFCRRHGFSPWVARLEAELGVILRKAGRDDEARLHVAEARTILGVLRLPLVERLLEENDVGREPVHVPSPRAPGDPLSLVREGEIWLVRWNGRQTRVKDSRGVRMLAHLAGMRGERVHSLALAAADTEHDPDGPVPAGDAGEMLDARAVREYRARLAAIEEDLSEAESFSDRGRCETLRRERDSLVSELARAVGLGGRLRKVGSASERARVNATRRIKDAVARISEADPEIGAHLEKSVKTGTYCSYGE